MREYPLSTANSGMTRLRSKGNAPTDTLYDLLNGYITIAGTIKPRPGTVDDITLPADTKGLVTHKCKLYTFKHQPDVTSNPDKYVVATLRHPEDSTIKLAQIHFAAAFMGYLYVVAEFADGNVWHYWLEELNAWTANSDYMIGDRVFPTVENGFAYQATRSSSPYQAWTPNMQHALNDVIEPTVYNGFKYTAVAVSGTAPTSGATEPDWPAQAGAQITEYGSGTAVVPITTSVLDPNPDLGTVLERYRNIAGGWNGGSISIP